MNEEEQIIYDFMVILNKTYGCQLIFQHARKVSFDGFKYAIEFNENGSIWSEGLYGFFLNEKFINKLLEIIEKEGVLNLKGLFNNSIMGNSGLDYLLCLNLKEYLTLALTLAIQKKKLHIFIIEVFGEIIYNKS